MGPGEGDFINASGQAVYDQLNVLATNDPGNYPYNNVYSLWTNGISTPISRPTGSDGSGSAPADGSAFYYVAGLNDNGEVTGLVDGGSWLDNSDGDLFFLSSELFSWTASGGAQAFADGDWMVAPFPYEMEWYGPNNLWVYNPVINNQAVYGVCDYNWNGIPSQSFTWAGGTPTSTGVIYTDTADATNDFSGVELGGTNIIVLASSPSGTNIEKDTRILPPQVFGSPSTPLQNNYTLNGATMPTTFRPYPTGINEWTSPIVAGGGGSTAAVCTQTGGTWSSRLLYDYLAGGIPVTSVQRVNAYGQMIIGATQTAYGPVGFMPWVGRGKLWQNGQIYDPTSLTPAAQGTNAAWTNIIAADINDSGAMVGTATYVGTSTAIAAGQHAITLFPAELAVDANRDGTIIMANDAGNPNNVDPTTGNQLPVDTTTQAKPFRFWVNNDEDNGAPNPDTAPYASEVVPAMPGTPNEGPVPDVASRDCDSSAIVSMRDLEDWTRLWIYTKGLNQAIHDAHILVGLKWKQVTRGVPGIKIVKATDSDGGTEYLTDKTFAAASAQATTDGTSPRPLIQDEASSSYIISASASSDPNRTADFVFPSATWTNLTDAAPKTFFLFEGASEGEGELEIVFLNADTGAKIGEGGCLWLDLRDIKEMYERETSQPVPAKPYNYPLSPPAVSIGPVPDTSNPDGNSGVFVADPTESSAHTYIVFVHGYNMTIAGSTNYAETMFKRLWWRGYKGRFAAFRWNTYGNGTAPSGDNPTGVLPGGAVGTYNDSEFVAWHSGMALKTYVQTLPSDYTIDVVSHSLGSVVVGQAIEDGMSPAHYALLHAAASASCYSTPAQVYPTTNFLSLYGSPDTSTDPATYALAYRFAFEDINSTHPVVNFYDDQDKVIGIYWEANNYLFKPQTIVGVGGSSGTYYYYHPGNLSGQKLGFESNSLLFRGLGDFGEARAYADFSLTQTIGSYDTTSAFGAISGGVDENQAGYNFGNHHSSEFNLSIQQLGPFYYDLLINFSIPQPFLDATHPSTE